MDKGNLSRRGFIERSLATAIGAGLPLWYARELAEGHLEAAEAAQKPNGEIRIGLIGCGGQGRGVMNGMLNDKSVKLVAVCDVDAKRRDETVKAVKERLTKEKREVNDIKTFEDFRQLNDMKDLDAVICGTVDHWHTLVSIDAMKKGKDVYCEKPLTLTIEEGKALVKVAKETKRIFQVGSQQRSDTRFRLAAELVRNGRLGKLKIIEARIGDNPQGGPYKESPVPAGLNWDFWKGPTPDVPYIKQRCHYEFRWWYDYSGGKLTDWGAHHLDQAQWALGMDESGPVAIEGLATEPSRDPNSYNCHHKFLVTYSYANGTKLLCSDRQLTNSLEPRHDNGILYVGEGNKWIFVNRGVIEASDQEARPEPGKKSKGIPGKKGGPSKLLDEALAADATRLYKSENHYRNWLDGIRTRKPCICTAEVGHRSVTVCHLGAICLRLGGKKLEWDPAKESFVKGHAAEGNGMVSRPMRGEWKLPA